MKCPSCGAEVAENVMICHECGTRLDEQSELSSEPSAGAVPLGEEIMDTSPAPQPGVDTGRQETPGNPQGGAKTAKTDAPPWKYSMKDMRIAWFLMLILTIAFAVLGAWMQNKGWVADRLSLSTYWGIVLGIPGLLWLYQMCKMVYRTTLRYDLDESRLIHKEGIFVATNNVIELIQIQDTKGTQNILEKFLCGGIGKVRVLSDDPTDPLLVLRGLENYESVWRQIDEARAKLRGKRAMVHAGGGGR